MSSSLRAYPRILLALAAIIIAGCVNLIYPFTGDQALFTIGARQLGGGALLYRDFWDLKQPGIYWFYLIVGRLFGFNEIGIHTGEVIYFTALAALIMLAMRRYFRSPAATAMAALLTVGVYFAVCQPWHLTQVEGLVAFPLLVCFFLTTQPRLGVSISPRRFFLAGVAAAVVVLFKLILILLPLSFVALAVIFQVSRGRLSLKKVLIATLLPAAAGMAAVLVPVILYFWSHGELALIYRTFFVYPPQVVSQLPGPGLSVLRSGIHWFMLASAPLLPFAAYGLLARLRGTPDAGVIAIIFWIILATLVVLMQRMWWQYHFLLPLFPVGLLAAIGFDEILNPSNMSPFLGLRRTGKPLLLICLAFLLGPYVLRLAIKSARELRDGLPLTATRQQQFQDHLNPSYRDAKREIAALDRTSAAAADIYVMGDPIIYYLSNRSQAVAINGWALEWLLPEQWDELAAQLNASQPRYIFRANDYVDILQHRGTAVMQVINNRYRQISLDPGGTWYELSKSP